MRVLFLFLLFAFTFCFSSFAQSFQDNLDKYWSYRDRLTTDFMVVGEEEGKSLPALYRDTATNELGYAETPVWHGWYMATLALEYHLLTNNYPDYDNGIPNALDNTKEELGLALRSTIRLDETGETDYYWPTTVCTSDVAIRNGFFIRDDVPAGFEPFYPGISLVRGAYNSSDIFLKEMSQDQAYHLLMGLAVIAKVIPDNLEYDGLPIRQEAIAQAKLIIEWMHRDNWMILNPVCFDNGAPKMVLRGGDVTNLSVGLNEMYKFFTDGTADFDSDINALAAFIWPTLQDPNNPGFGNIDNKHMTSVLSAVGNAFGDSTYTVLMDLAEEDRWHIWPLLHSLLHDATGSPNFATLKPEMDFWVDSLIKAAPVSFPICTWPNVNTHGYSAINRFLRTIEEQYEGRDINVNRVWNGLDFMLLYNLNYAVNPNLWPQDTTSIIEKDEQLAFSLYPNPASSKLFVELPQGIDGGKVLVYNIQGSEVLNAEITSGRMELNTAELSSGCYAVKVVVGNSVGVELLVVE